MLLNKTKRKQTKKTKQKNTTITNLVKGPTKPRGITQTSKHHHQDRAVLRQKQHTVKSQPSNWGET